MSDSDNQSPPRPDQDAQILTGSIDDYLLGLADGIQKAQRQISQMALVIQPGEAAVIYQIPRVEFELKMSLEVVSPTDGAGGGGSLLRFRPASPARGGGSTTADVASTIRGAFVAVPVHGGKPPPQFRTTLRQIDLWTLEVTVQVTSAAGERLAGVDVHFNVDREQSKAITVTRTGALPPGVYDAKEAAYDQISFDASTDLDPDTRFWDGLVTTDAGGLAVGVLNVAVEEPPDTRIVFVVDVLGQTETIVFVVE
jgi:hypothetical protein